MSYLNSMRWSDKSITQSASGALRTSEMTTLFDGKILGADDPDSFTNVGTGTGLFTANKYQMTVTAGQYLVRQANRFNPYFSGKPQIVEETCDNFQTQAGIVKRFGYFSSNAIAPYDSNKDGFWLEDNGTTKRIICSRAGTETLNKPFNEWDGYSKLQSYNWTNFTVCFWDFLWLGGAVLRLWVKTDNGFILAHSIKHAGNYTDVMMLSPNQPVRYEIRSTGGSGMFRYICSQVATEGSTDESGKPICVRNQTSAALACNTVGNTYILSAIRKLSSFRDIAIKISSIGCINQGTSDNGILSIVKNPTVTGASLTFSANPSGLFEQAINTNPAILASPGTGRELMSIPVSAGGIAYPIKDDYFAYLGNDINNQMDTYALCYSPVTINQSVFGIFNLQIQ